MKPKTVWVIVSILCFFTVVVTPPAFASDAQCALAQKIGESAAQQFKKDKREGLQLFIKAHGLCPDDASLNFNLGLAYFRYGNLKEAESYLKKSVSKDDNGDWLNLLAWVMLENRSNKTEALEYAQKAVKLNSKSPAAFDTLIRAYLENNQLYEASLNAKKARDKWPKDEKIAKRYDTAIDGYISHYLKKAETGNHEDALAGLRKIDFDPTVRNAYCWALHASGRTEDALGEAKRAKEKFHGSQILADTFDEIMDRYIQACYQEFKAGKRADAVMAVDKMKEKYAAHAGLKDAYDRMMNAILNEADTIAVPEPMKIASKDRKTGGEGAGLLDKLQSAGDVQGGDKDLLVDVDINIPKGKQERPDAIAVIIGNKNYARFGRGIPDVDYAARDAAYMKKYVTGLLGYRDENVIYTLDATQGQISRIFGSKGNFRGQLCNWVKPGKSDVFIYYVGHGAPDPEGKGAYLMPVDASADYISANGYALDTFYDNLEKIPARSITVVLDACFSGNSAGGMLVKNVSPGILKSATPVRKMNNAVIFSGAGKDQVSHWYPEKRHSLFTYFFMKGLRGDADKNKNKSITLSELKSYLSDKVPYRARRLTGREQTPVVLGDELLEIVRLQ
ncbi:MAG: caspase family protein [Syntrophaceae bacterium]|nr:caspase family protein [Syntrophaceae bacterium]